jgi:hypothetical protein
LTTCLSGYNLGTEILLGANWGSQTYTYRIREEREREDTTWQHLIGPPQPCGSHHYTDLTCGPHICHVALTHWSMSAATSPDRDTWPDLIGPHYRPHQHYCHLAVCEWCTIVKGGAKLQHTEKPPQLCMPYGRLLLVHLTIVGPTLT